MGKKRELPRDDSNDSATKFYVEISYDYEYMRFLGSFDIIINSALLFINYFHFLRCGHLFDERIK